jgi:dTDP-glucose pyrophosphorylase
LAERDGISVIQRILESCSVIENKTLRFAALDSDVFEFNLNDVLKQLSKEIQVCVTSALTKGSACTALLAACNLNQEDELLIISANEIVEINFNTFLEDCRLRNLDAATVIFQSVHPRYSYVKFDQNDFITEFAQREPISNAATAGFFWFKKTSNFVNAAMDMILSRETLNGNFYIGLTINELILGGMKIGFTRISERNYSPLKDQIQVVNYQIGK